nr:hypothetical protein [Burkholderia sp. NRF60-BP8]
MARDTPASTLRVSRRHSGSARRQETSCARIRFRATETRRRRSRCALAVIPIGFIREGVVLRDFSPVTTVGTPQSAAAQELRMECMFPADDATDARHRQWLDAHAPAR